MTEKTKGNLPAGWTHTTIAELSLPTFTRNPQVSGQGNFAYIDIEAIDNLRQRIERPKRLQNGAAPSRARNAVLPGDVIFSLVRPYLKNIAIIPSDLADAVASTAFFVCRPGAGVDSRYIFNYFRQDAFISSIVTYGNSPPSAHDDEFAQLVLPLPPAKEQERIADALDELLSDLDAGVAALERARGKLKLYRAAVLKAAVEGVLTSGWRKQHPHAEPASELLKRTLIERRRRWEEEQLRKFEENGRDPPKNWKAKYKEPVPPATSDLPPLPEGWCWTSLDALIVGGPQNGIYLHSEFYGRGVEILRIDDFQNGWSRPREELKRVDADQDSISSYALHLRDIVINRVNSMTHLGKCCLISDGLSGVLFESNMMRMETSEKIEARFVELYLHSEAGRRRLTKDAKWAVNQASINQEDVKRTPVPLPPLTEQKALIEATEVQLSVIEHLESDLTAKLISARVVRQSILRDAFSGKLVPQNQSDEPASQLLKQIAAEREQRLREAAAAKLLSGRQPRRAAKTRSKVTRVKTTKKKEPEHGRISDR